MPRSWDRGGQVADDRLAAALGSAICDVRLLSAGEASVRANGFGIDGQIEVSGSSLVAEMRFAVVGRPAWNGHKAQPGRGDEPRAA